MDNPAPCRNTSVNRNGAGRDDRTEGLQQVSSGTANREFRGDKQSQRLAARLLQVMRRRASARVLRGEPRLSSEDQSELGKVATAEPGKVRRHPSPEHAQNQVRLISRRVRSTISLPGEGLRTLRSFRARTSSEARHPRKWGARMAHGKLARRSLPQIWTSAGVAMSRMQYAVGQLRNALGTGRRCEAAGLSGGLR